uniref:Uncharacterized protein n=1 Tax=Arundo donax TaxID=35708 RepID=A0A0A9C1L1_ARUDO
MLIILVVKSLLWLSLSFTKQLHHC